MSGIQRWQLPDGVEELLPDAAHQLEALRRSLTDLHLRYGYELVNPPLIEYLDSLLTGSGETLELQTFKLVDQISGRMMGVRADMTPQITRIDAHLLKREDISRLFYMGSILRTRPDAPGGSRSPLQLGAELYGDTGVEGDIEIISLMLDCVALSNIETPLLDLGHVGVFRSLLESAELSSDQQLQLHEAMVHRSRPGVEQCLAEFAVASEQSRMIAALLDLNGESDVLASARSVLSAGGRAVAAALDELEAVANALTERRPSIRLHLDLTELRGYSYHTGLTFSVFSDLHRHQIARGGRYDDIGAAFGYKRPATGFSTDLKLLSQLSNASLSTATGGVFVADTSVDGVWQEIERLRTSGERVVTRFASSSLSAQAVDCDRELHWQNGQWVQKPVG